ncbi:MAG: dynamin family protein, partial [Oscillospiraceae bacterium]
MDLQERIVYNKDELFRSIDEMMEKLREIYSDSRFRELLGDNLAEKLRKWEHNIRDRKNDPYTIVVCGEFKRGKSSLINALLREDAAVVNITAETVTVNRITMGEHSNEAVLSGGRRLKLSDEEMCRERLEDIIS